ncbi:DUF3558 domain-containing protein [Mycolicibacterium tusciae]|uniref:DUF3558 domain-containing protein n=1 Tax=Mycolicibacterium tusciae TaxID=75922 RepID=UPI00024A29D4|nr:DUF3558 domain-containing protein [Mycolicibacterium tusciae]
MRTGHTHQRRGAAGALIAALAAVSVLAGCTSTVEGTATKSGTGAGPRNNDSERQYPNLQKECDVLTEDILAETVKADPLDIQSTFVGAVCRWQAANPTGLVDITRFWFEEGSLDNEREVADQLGYRVESKSVAGIDSIVMHPDDPNGACGVASDAVGVVGWWVNPQSPGSDACAMALKLMELTLATRA